MGIQATATIKKFPFFLFLLKFMYSNVSVWGMYTYIYTYISPRIIRETFMATFWMQIPKSNQKWHVVVTLIKLQIISD